jgi:hypothetical protein
MAGARRATKTKKGTNSGMGTSALPQHLHPVQTNRRVLRLMAV